MTDSSSGLHEPPGALSPVTVDRHRAIVSLMEELEAIDWYEQRIDAATDPELADILAHNRDEEKEHAAMVLEWLRRRDPVLDQQLRTYLFTSETITMVEREAMGVPDLPDRGDTGADGSLGIGSLKGRRRCDHGVAAPGVPAGSPKGATE